jgi:transglutaminase-like putative cysteine protease
VGSVVATLLVLALGWRGGRAVFHALRGPARTDRTVRYSFTVRNRTNRALLGQELEVFAPLEMTAFQRVTGITASDPYEVRSGKLGEQLLVFRLPVLPPYGRKELSLTATLQMADAPVRGSTSYGARYLGAERYIEVDDPRMKEAARRIKRGADDRATARNIFNWVTGNVRPVGYIAQDLGALYALVNKRGDCTEFTDLFTALARAKGIPARAVAGFLLPRDAIVTQRDYHSWSEVYLDSAWRIVDPERGVFLTRQEDYVALQILSDKPEVTISSTNSFFSHPPNVTVTLK